MQADPNTRPEHGSLSGWPGQGIESALAAFRAAPDGAIPRHVIDAAADAASFFEAHFTPSPSLTVLDGFATGYFEPVLDAALTPDPDFPVPLYAMPPSGTGPMPTRRAIDAGGALAGQGLELAWLRSTWDAYVLHIQGSGCLRLADGQTRRIAFAGKNGHSYTSIGKQLISRGIFTPQTISMAAIGNWVHANGAQGLALLHENDSYVFFRLSDDAQGPRGTLGAPLTPFHSLAVDPAWVPLGTPIWVTSPGPVRLSQVMIAQDTGGAIRGRGRVDVFTGSGAEAGAIAGSLQQVARLVPLIAKSTRS